MILVSIRTHTKVFVSKIVQRVFVRCVFESDFEKGFLCNGSHFYKNAYKVLSFENVSNGSVGV